MHCDLSRSRLPSGEGHDGEAVRERNCNDTGHADTFADHGRRAGANEHEREGADQLGKELDAILLDFVLSGDEINRWRDQARAKQQYVGWGRPTEREAPPAGEANGPTSRRSSAV